MLKPPYTNYSRIFTYHVDGHVLPEIVDTDLIGTWVEDGKTIFIFHKNKDELIDNFCREHGCELFYKADVDYVDWEMGRKVTLFSVGPLSVAPIWEKQPADIRIDPSVVFGNGFHPSTRLCLESLVFYRDTLQTDFSALDLGCGTGLLAIGAVRLGASQVLAVDYNPLACQVTGQNAIYNNADNFITVRQMDLRADYPSSDFDIVMANLHPELLINLFQKPQFWNGSLFIISGFMAHDEEKLLAALPNNPPSFLNRFSRDKWRAWVLGRDQTNECNSTDFPETARSKKLI
jgi:ribosomal protein L11 methyltransferase